jgi:hypothetical protein
MSDLERVLFMRKLTKDHVSSCDCVNCPQAKKHLSLIDLHAMYSTLHCDLIKGEFKNGRRGD